MGLDYGLLQLQSTVTAESIAIVIPSQSRRPFPSRIARSIDVSQPTFAVTAHHVTPGTNGNQVSRALAHYRKAHPYISTPVIGPHTRRPADSESEFAPPQNFFWHTSLRFFHLHLHNVKMAKFIKSGKVGMYKSFVSARTCGPSHPARV